MKILTSHIKDVLSKKHRQPCIGLEGFMRWQIERYRKAVSEDRWYMSQNQQRFVGWTEAELDFICHGTYGCASEWRHEYCSSLCPHSGSCDLGQRFCDDSSNVTVST